MKANQRLRRERELRGWSQSRVAEEVGTDPPTVSRWERGFSLPSPYFREKLCALFGKDASALGLLHHDQDEPATQQLDELPVPASIQQLSPSISCYDPAIPLPPPELSALVGREMLLDQLRQRLCYEKQSTLIVLHGLPGVGKTALAVALAHDPTIHLSFSDGILWAGLGPTPNIPALLSRWAMVLQLSSLETSKMARNEDWALALHNAIGRRRMLIVIDDAWTIETALAFKLGGPHCSYLITTRVPQVALHFSAEETCRVPELDEQESLALLARFVPSLIASDPASAHSLVNAVGGLPLALTLMGKHLRTQASTGQPRRLSNAIRQVCDAKQRLFLSEPYAPIDRQPSLPPGTPLSLDSVIAVSEQHIDENARTALRALSVFPARPNSFSEEAALAVSQVPVEALDMLSDAGLLDSPEPHRYLLHQTIADYARAHLTDPQPSQRLITYMLHFVESHSSDYNVLDQECQNIIAALELARASQPSEDYIRLIIAFAPFLLIRSMHTLALEHLQQAYQFACASDDPRIITLLSQLGHSMKEQGNYAEAESYLQEGLALAQQRDDAEQIDLFQLHLAEVLEQRGDYAQANLYLQKLAFAPQIRSYEWCWSFYPRMAADHVQDNMCVYFTETQSMIRRGYLADIDPLVRAWPYADSFSPTVLQAITGPDAHFYALPTSPYAMCLLYNRRLFKEAGLDPDNPPTTWTEFQAVAREIARPAKGIFGYVQSSIHNHGGWHFTSWLYTAGIMAQQSRAGRWLATFNDPKAVELLEMFKAMRFIDRSVPRQSLLDARSATTLFTSDKVAMMVASSGTLADLYFYNPSRFSDYGIAPIPQNGSNACLMGGNAYVFSTRLSPATLKKAVERVLSDNFDPARYEALLQTRAAANQPIGLPTVPLFTGPFQHHLDSITARYTNIPLQNYQNFLNADLHLNLEPPIETQKYYALLDPVVQAVFTDPHANPHQLLDKAAQQFQTRFLDRLYPQTGDAITIP